MNWRVYGNAFSNFNNDAIVQIRRVQREHGHIMAMRTLPESLCDSLISGPHRVSQGGDGNAGGQGAKIG